jgi:hypothetical protein
MNAMHSRLGIALLLAVAWLTPVARGSVIVVSNRAPEVVGIRLASAAAPRGQDLRLAPGDSAPLRLSEPGQLSIAGRKGQPYRVFPGGVYYISPAAKQLELGQISLSTPAAGKRRDAPPPLTAAETSGNVVIPVKILHDDDEVATRSRWEARIRKRFDAANAILKQACFVEFRIVAIESWHSDEAALELRGAFQEFEEAVDPGPGHLAIGFTGRQGTAVFDRKFGGTRGPLTAHLLLRESSHKTEHELLESLVHALGHYLGAAHSPEAGSVMRSKLDDHQARSAGHRITFDPLNMLAMCLVSDELRRDPRLQFSEISPEARDELQRLYIELSRAGGADRTAAIYLKRLGQN